MIYCAFITCVYYVPFIGLITYFFEDILYIELFPYSADLSDYPILEGLLYGLSLGIKSSVMIFTFI
ncbi:MAG: hypothetical protein EOP34_07845 [Rickettsiales bacterium]|nr:MAG: hypothetical protein EOP34_07845 [Rickettsiales bacterium]